MKNSRVLWHSEAFLRDVSHPSARGCVARWSLVWGVIARESRSGHTGYLCAGVLGCWCACRCSSPPFSVHKLDRRSSISACVPRASSTLPVVCAKNSFPGASGIACWARLLACGPRMTSLCSYTSPLKPIVGAH